jgi:hypothetical protein
MNEQEAQRTLNPWIARGVVALLTGGITKLAGWLGVPMQAADLAWVVPASATIASFASDILVKEGHKLYHRLKGTPMEPTS